MAKLVPTLEPLAAVKYDWLLRLSVILRAICIPGTFFVFLLYWGLVYDGGYVSTITPFTHGANFGIMLIEILLNRQKFNLLHGVYFLGFAATYLTWSLIFHVSGLNRDCNCADDDDIDAGGCRDRGDGNYADQCTYIYGTLNWSPESFTKTLIIVCLILFVFSPLIIIGFYLLILFLRNYCTSEGTAEISKPLSPSFKHQDTMEVLRKGGCCAALKSEFQLHRLRPEIEEWAETCRSSRSPAIISDWAFLYIRGALFLFMFSIMIWGVCTQTGGAGYWFIYLTNWTLFSEVFYLAVAFVVTLLAQREPQPSSMAEVNV